MMSMHRNLIYGLVPVVLLAMLLAMALTLPVSASSAERHSPAVTATAVVRSATRTPGITPTPAPTTVDRTQPGSTDGLVLMSFAIAAIIVVPLLLQREIWKK